MVMITYLSIKRYFQFTHILWEIIIHRRRQIRAEQRLCVAIWNRENSLSVCHGLLLLLHLSTRLFLPCRGQQLKKPSLLQHLQSSPCCSLPLSRYDPSLSRVLMQTETPQLFYYDHSCNFVCFPPILTERINTIPTLCLCHWLIASGMLFFNRALLCLELPLFTMIRCLALIFYII